MPSEPEERSASARPATFGFRAMVRFSDFLGWGEHCSVEARRADWGQSPRNRRLRRRNTESIESTDREPRSAQMLPRPRGIPGHQAAPPTHRRHSQLGPNLKFPRKGASRLHPHPPHPTGPGPVRSPRAAILHDAALRRARNPPPHRSFLHHHVSLGSCGAAVLHASDRAPPPQGLLTHHAGEPRMIGTLSVPTLRP